MVDTGTTKSVAGLRTAKLIALTTGESLQQTPSSRTLSALTRLQAWEAVTSTTLHPSEWWIFSLTWWRRTCPFLAGLDAPYQHRLQAFVGCDTFFLSLFNSFYISYHFLLSIRHSQIVYTRCIHVRCLFSYGHVVIPLFNSSVLSVCLLIIFCYPFHVGPLPIRSLMIYFEKE